MTLFERKNRLNSKSVIIPVFPYRLQNTSNSILWNVTRILIKHWALIYNLCLFVFSIKIVAVWVAWNTFKSFFYQNPAHYLPLIDVKWTPPFLPGRFCWGAAARRNGAVQRRFSTAALHVCPPRHRQHLRHLRVHGLPPPRAPIPLLLRLCTRQAHLLSRRRQRQHQTGSTRGRHLCKLRS